MKWQPKHKRIVPKQQFGGFTVPPALTNALSLLDFNNPDYNKTVDAGVLTNPNFLQAFNEDNPDLIAKGLLGNAVDYSAENAPGILSQEEMNDEIKRKTFLGIGKGKVRRQLEAKNEYLESQARIKLPYETNQNLDFAGSVFGLLDSFNFQEGGAVPMPQVKWGQKETLPTLKVVDDYASKIKSLPDTKEAKLALGAILVNHMGVDLKPDHPNFIKLFKESYEIDVNEKGKANNKLTPKFLEQMSQEFRRFTLHNEDVMRSFSSGGTISPIENDIQTKGYSDDSPYQGLSAINIYSDTIDMSQTGRPIIALPDNGKPKLLEPYSGIHKFRGAGVVTEIPMSRPKGKKKKTYQFGGGQSTPPVGVQMEDGELFITPELDIMESAALTSHDKMEKDKVTDVLRKGDYVLSQRPSFKVTKKAAEKISFGLGAMLYKENEKPEMPEEQTLAKFFKEKEDELTFAELAQRVRDEYKTNEREDVFSKRTNDTNKAARFPYLSALAFLNEKKRTGQKFPESGFASEFENMFEEGVAALSGEQHDPNAYAVQGTTGKVQEFQEGGVQKFQPGGLESMLINAGVQLFSGVSNLISAGANRRRTKRAYAADRVDIKKLSNLQSGYANLAGAVSAAGIIGQNPVVDAPQYSSANLDAMVRRLPKTLFDFQASRLAAANQPYMNTLFQNARNFGDAVNAFSPVQAASIGSMATMGLHEAQQNLALENSYRTQKQRLSEAQELANVGAGNATRANSNALLSGLSRSVAGTIGTQGQIASDEINSLRYSRLNETSALNQASQNTANAVGQIGMGVGYAAQGIFGQPPANQPPTVVGNNANTTNQPITQTSPTVLPGLPANPGLNQPFYTQQPNGVYAVYNPTTGWTDTGSYSPPMGSPGLQQAHFDPILNRYVF